MFWDFLKSREEKERAADIAFGREVGGLLADRMDREETTASLPHRPNDFDERGKRAWKKALATARKAQPSE